MGFTKEDVVRSEALRAERRRLAEIVSGLDEKKSSLAGAEKGCVTRESNRHLDAITEIDKELEGLPVQIVNPDRAHGIVMGHVLATKARYEQEKKEFVERALVNPTSAIDWAEHVVRKQEQWFIIRPASETDNYDDLVAELERISERLQEDLLYESLCCSTTMFHNAVSLAKHKARVGGKRWGVGNLLEMIRQCFADGVEAWKLLNEEEGSENED